MKLHFDDKFLHLNKGGIGRDSYSTLQLIKNLTKTLPRNFEVTVKTENLSNFSISSLLRLFTSSKKDLYFFSQVTYIPRRLRKRSIFRIHDIFPITYPQFFSVKARLLFHFSVLCLSPKSIYICNSESTKDAFLNYRPQLADSTYVGYCQVPDLSKKRCGKCSGCARSIWPNKYLLSVGTVEPRKNYELLFSTLDDIDDEINFVIVGRYGWKSGRTEKKLLSSPRVLWINDACDGIVAELYKNSQAFVSTSIDEGFNLPSAEAGECGSRLILSDIPIHREIHGYRAHYFTSRIELISLINHLEHLETSPLRRGNEISFEANSLESTLREALIRIGLEIV